MKKILSLVIAILFTTSLSSFAQGNLQFNQVISGSITLSPGGILSAITVPTGKVWKIEAIQCSRNTASDKYLINGLSYIIYSNNSAAYNAIWLKEGDTFSLKNDYTGTGASSQNFVYSILEFNIVP